MQGPSTSLHLIHLATFFVADLGMQLAITELDDMLSNDYHKLKFDPQYTGVYFVLGTDKTRRIGGLLPTRPLTLSFPTKNE